MTAIMMATDTAEMAAIGRQARFIDEGRLRVAAQEVWPARCFFFRGHAVGGLRPILLKNSGIAARADR